MILWSSFGYVLITSMVVESARALPLTEQPKDEQPSGNVIVVEGVRREASRPRRAGQSLVMRPSDETRFDAKSLLKNEANITLPDTGKTTASGFTVPRVRGQDARLTEVFIEGLRVQDPYAGYPVVDDLDLRSCGEMTLYVGGTPPALPTVNPNGVLAYRLVERQRRSQQLGLSMGKPYGTAAWTLFHYQKRTDDETASTRFRLYAREHWTKGEFVYYDDNLTPYNRDDDRYSLRRHADRHARQILPSFAWTRGQHRISGVGLWNDSETSVPARMSGVDSQTREYDTHRLGRLAYTFQLQVDNPFVPQLIGVEAGVYDDDVNLRDPTGTVLGFVQTTSRELDSKVGAANITWKQQAAERPIAAYLRGESKATRILAMTGRLADYRLARQQEVIYAGFELPVPHEFFIELKHQLVSQVDQLTLGKSPRTSIVPIDTNRKRYLQGSSAAVAWQPRWGSIYAQLARNERAPSLLEEFGDGALVRDNPSLHPEMMLHRELGFQSRLGELSEIVDAVGIRAAVFQDLAKDRIVILPSLGQTVRAQNASDTDIHGVEFGADLTLDQVTITGGYARLVPLDKSSPGRVRQIPGVSRDVATGSLAWNITSWTLRWATRYQSQIWRDTENSIAIPGYMIHDASVDTQIEQFALGFAVYNVTNQQKSEIRAVRTGANRGYTSYGDYAGMPLPGRQFRLNISAEI